MRPPDTSQERRSVSVRRGALPELRAEPVNRCSPTRSQGPPRYRQSNNSVVLAPKGESDIESFSKSALAVAASVLLWIVAYWRKGLRVSRPAAARDLGPKALQLWAVDHIGRALEQEAQGRHNEMQRFLSGRHRRQPIGDFTITIAPQMVNNVRWARIWLQAGGKRSVRSASNARSGFRRSAASGSTVRRPRGL